MQIGQPGIHELFKQLGLPSTEESIATFIRVHRPDLIGCSLFEAPVWTAAQADFLREAVDMDAEWAQPVESLAVALSRR